MHYFFPCGFFYNSQIIVQISNYTGKISAVLQKLRTCLIYFGTVLLFRCYPHFSTLQKNRAACLPDPTFTFLAVICSLFSSPIFDCASIVQCAGYKLEKFGVMEQTFFTKKPKSTKNWRQNILSLLYYFQYFNNYILCLCHDFFVAPANFFFLSKKFHWSQCIPFFNAWLLIPPYLPPSPENPTSMLFHMMSFSSKGGVQMYNFLLPPTRRLSPEGKLSGGRVGKLIRSPGRSKCIFLSIASLRGPGRPKLWPPEVFGPAAVFRKQSQEGGGGGRTQVFCLLW